MADFLQEKGFYLLLSEKLGRNMSVLEKKFSRYEYLSR